MTNKSTVKVTTHNRVVPNLLQYRKTTKNPIIGYFRYADESQLESLEYIVGRQCGILFADKGNDKTQYNLMMDALQDGDTLVTFNISDIIHSISRLLSFVAGLQDRGIHLKSISEAWIDTTGDSGDVFMDTIRGLMWFEKDAMQVRTKQGIDVAKQNGTVFGKPLQEGADIENAINQYLNHRDEYTVTQIAKMNNISRATLWRHLKKRGLLTE